MTRKLLVIDTACSFDTIVGLKLKDFVTCRDLGGYFEHVWTVHPFASLVSGEMTLKFGKPEVHKLTAAHTFIDGKIGRFDLLKKVSAVNFLIGQIGILAKLISLVRKEKISAVRTCEPLYCGLLGLLISRICGIPLIIRVNANYDKIFETSKSAMMPRLFRSYRLEKKIVRFVLSRTDLVAAVNKDNLDFAISNGARSEFSTIFRYGNMIDKRHVASPESRDLSGAALNEFWAGKRKFLLYIGRLQSIKHPEDNIKVTAEVQRRGHDIKLLMVGDGPEQGALAKLAQELGIEDHVVFCGNRDQDWLSRVIPLAAVVLSPVTGRALAEAAFGAAPIVAYDWEWQGELIRGGETGELVPFRSVEKMADATIRFLVDVQYGRAMGKAARKRAFTILDPDTLDQHEREKYSELFLRFGKVENMLRPTIDPD